MLSMIVGAQNVPPVTGSYYLVQSMDSDAALALKAEGKTNIVTIADITSTNITTMGKFFDNVKDGDHIELVLAENIYAKNNTEGVGIIVVKPITLTIKYNGFIHAVNDNSKATGIYVKNQSATLRLIGSKAMDENGVISSEFIAPTFTSNGFATVGNLDVYHGKDYAWIDDGTFYMENLRGYSGQEVVFTRDSSNKTVYDVCELVNCAFDSAGTCVGLEGKENAKKIIKIDGCYFKNGLTVQTVMTGSYIKNTKIEGVGFTLDCWSIAGQLLELENCTINKVTTYTGRTHLQFTDCKFSISNVSLGSDGGGKSYLYVITSPTCEAAGTKITYRNGNMAGEEDASYPAQHPPYHIADELNAIAISYENYLSKGIYTAPCERCGKVITEEKGTVSELFVFLGYSTPEDGSYGIVASYTVNKNAVSKYEQLSGKTLSYGLVAGVKSSLGDKNPLDENGDEIILEDSVVIKAPVSKNSIGYDFVIKDMAESQLSLELVVATYVVVTEGEDVSVVYLQETQKTENLGAISYNAIPKEEEK